MKSIAKKSVRPNDSLNASTIAKRHIENAFVHEDWGERRRIQTFEELNTLAWQRLGARARPREFGKVKKG